MEHGFNRKIFTAKMYLSDFGYLILNAPKLIAAYRNEQITMQFFEKIMLITTTVTGCIYCTWFHANRALECGMSEEEIINMMKLQFETDASEFELMGLLYTQHFSETNRKVDNEMTVKLYDYYGENTAEQIVFLIRFIFSANLFGNTWDAVISRFKGNPAPNSSILFEMVYLLTHFIIAIPFIMVMNLDKKPNYLN